MKENIIKHLTFCGGGYNVDIFIGETSDNGIRREERVAKR